MGIYPRDQGYRTALEKDYTEIDIKSYCGEDEGEEQTTTWRLFTTLVAKSFLNSLFENKILEISVSGQAKKSRGEISASYMSKTMDALSQGYETGIATEGQRLAV